MLISTRNLTMTYGTGHTATHALAGVDLGIYPGSLAMMGPSGSGKTTLLHCLAGILRPTGGSVTFRDTDLARLSDRKRTALRRRDFGFVFQSGQLLAELPADENAALPLMLDGMDSRAAITRARAWMGTLGLAGMEDRRPGQLSGGQAQRVAIARALVTGPSVVFADEPTGALDQQTGQQVMHTLVNTVVGSNAALVVVTHEPAIAQTCERTITMRDGRIIAEHHAGRGATRMSAVTEQMHKDSTVGPVGHAGNAAANHRPPVMPHTRAAAGSGRRPPVGDALLAEARDVLVGPTGQTGEAYR